MRKTMFFLVCLLSVFAIAACENSIECRDSSGNVRTWSTVNCPAYKCKGADLICCDGAICGDTCYNDMSKLSSTQGCVVPGGTQMECAANQIYDYASKACKNMSSVTQEGLGCSLTTYNRCFLDCLHNEKRECDKATCTCGDYFCQTKLDCPSNCLNAECVISSDGRSKCACG